MTTKLMLAAAPPLRAALAELFAGEPLFTFVEAPAAKAAAIASDPADVLLLADDFSEADPAALLRAARAAGFEGAAILLARMETAVAPDFDAWLRRPLRFAELLALIRRTLEERAQKWTPLSFGECEVCAATQTLRAASGAQFALTEKEVAILERLARAKGDIVAREVLLRDVWGYNASVVTHTLETHIHRLRRKIEKATGRSGLLVTAQGGYRLAAGDEDEGAET